MKKPVAFFLFLSVSLLAFQCQVKPEIAPAESVRQAVKKDLDSLHAMVKDQLLPLTQPGRDPDSLQQTFLACRAAYKRIEHFAEYFMPSTSRMLNGPPLNEIEAEENKSFEPGGFQVIEEYLFPETDTTQRAELVRETRNLLSHLNRAQIVWDNTDVTDDHVFDAVRLQVVRILTLGLSGFDTPGSKSAMPESAVSLAALSDHLKYYQAKQQNPALQAVLKTFAGAMSYLNANRDFDSFDRMAFITSFGNPLSAQLLDCQKSLGIENVAVTRVLRADAPTIFEPGAFDPNAFVAWPEDRPTAAKVKLGKRLFYDPVLSANNQRSCASCHQPEKAFTDGLAKSENIHKAGPVARNTPTILNAALQGGQFYDLRVANLEGQTRDVIESKEEMHGSLKESVRKLQADSQYMEMFKKAFPKMKDSLAPYFIQNALASYERSLVSFDSRFDRYVRGDKPQMNAREINGFNLFMGKAKCGTCHFMPLFNGTVPPGFNKTEVEVIGVPATPQGRKIDPDLGRYRGVMVEQMKYAFKTTTVRNVALTAPYMHNGVYRTLEEVVDFYNKGGGAGLGIDLHNQTLPFDKLDLTAQEQKDIVAFMKTLTSVPTGSIGKPQQLAAR